jgi:hypothetical protein
VREKLTKGNIHFLSELLDAYQAQLLHDLDESRRKSVVYHVRDFAAAKTSLHHLDQLGQILPEPDKSILSPDRTTYITVDNGFRKLALEEVARTFGKYGGDAISSLPELLLYTTALAKAFGSRYLYYRGEPKYGYRLSSRAERHLGKSEGIEPGITSRELLELRRFQREFRSSPPYDISADAILDDDNDPRWLPIMQHYDEKFGTRLLDITSSPFSGSYFACVSWDGNIDETADGLIYAFLVGRLGATVHGHYFDETPEKYVEEMDDLPVSNLESCFRDWAAPHIPRLYQSSIASPRSIAQDGSFLVRGALTDEYDFGQGFKFRVPAEAKENLARELWLAGYTPSRMVRGEIGREAEKNLETRLEMGSL